MAYPGFSAQQRSQCSTRISAGADVGRGSLKSLHHFISSSDYNVFIVLQCHLKDQFVPKNDVKQCFTTTTTTTMHHQPHSPHYLSQSPPPSTTNYIHHITPHNHRHYVPQTTFTTSPPTITATMHYQPHSPHHLPQSPPPCTTNHIYHITFHNYHHYMHH